MPAASPGAAFLAEANRGLGGADCGIRRVGVRSRAGCRRWRSGGVPPSTRSREHARCPALPADRLGALRQDRERYPGSSRWNSGKQRAMRSVTLERARIDCFGSRSSRKRNAASTHVSGVCSPALSCSQISVAIATRWRSVPRPRTGSPRTRAARPRQFGEPRSCQSPASRRWRPWWPCAGCASSGAPELVGWLSYGGETPGLY